MQSQTCDQPQVAGKGFIDWMLVLMCTIGLLDDGCGRIASLDHQESLPMSMWALPVSVAYGRCWCAGEYVLATQLSEYHVV